MTWVGVLNAVAALDVRTNSVEPTVYGYASLPQQLSAGQLPARLVFPTEARGATGSFSVVQLGQSGLIRATRTIADVLLLQPVVEGRVAATAIEALVEYVDAYEAALQGNRALGLTGAIVTSCHATVGITTWPEGGTPYWSAAITLEVEDYV